MEVLNRFAIFIAIGCLVFVLYEANQPESLSEQEKAQIQEIIGQAIEGHLATYNSNLEAKADRVLEESGAQQTLQIKKETIDRLVMSGIRIASDAQAWKRKPAAFGGGQKKEGFDELTLEQLGYPVDNGGRHNTINGICELNHGLPGRLRVFCSNEPLDILIQVTISGMSAQDIETKILDTDNTEG